MSGVKRTITFMWVILVSLVGTTTADQIVLTAAYERNVFHAGGPTDAAQMIRLDRESGDQAMAGKWDSPTGNWPYVDNAGTVDAWVYFDLGVEFDLEEIRLWNMDINHTDNAPYDWHVKNMSIHVAGDGAVMPSTAAGLGEYFTDASWTSIWDGDLARGPVPTSISEGQLLNPELVLDATGINGVRYIAIDIDSRYGTGSGLTGLGHIQVSGKDLRLAELVAPDLGETHVAVDTTLEWSSPSAFVPSDYKLYLRKDNSNFADTGNNILDGVSVTPDTPTTTYSLTDLDGLATYYWRVDSVDSAGPTTHTGKTWNFTTVIAPPETIVQTATWTETVTMRLTKENLRGDHFELWVQNSTGGYDVVTPPVTDRSYIGTVDEYPNALSCGILLDNGNFMGAVYFDRGETWYTDGTSVFATKGSGYDPATFGGYQWPTVSSVTTGQAGTTMYGYDVGIDADYDYYTAMGFSTWKALEMIEYSVAVTRALYMRDALLQPYLGRVILRASPAHDPYVGYMDTDYLHELVDEWNANHTSADRDLVAGVSTTRVGGGWAQMSSVGNGYSVNLAVDGSRQGNFNNIWRHEMGHNWSCGHSVGGAPEGSGLMGGNQAGRMTGCEVYKVLNHRNARIGYLDDLGSYAPIDIPPYAAMDAVSASVGAPVAIDVTGNDFDANGETISLDTYDSTTENGANVTLSVGTGPGGRDELIYTPTVSSDSASYGVDFIHYTIIDSSGQTATGVVILDVGTRALNLSAPAHEAEFVDTATTLTWALPGEAFRTTYKVFLDPDLASVIDGTADVTATDDDSDDTNLEFVPPADLAGGTRYYWRVEGDDVEPFSSAVWTFRTDSAGSMITGTSLDDFTTEMSGREAINCINGSGLSGLTHNNTDNDMWMTTGFGPDNDPYVVIDLGAVYDIDMLREWGYNAGDNNTYFGIDEVDIYTSLNGVDFTYGQTLNFGLAPTPTTSAYAGVVHGVSLDSARYIKLDVMTSQEGSIFDGTGTVAGTQDPWARGLVGLAEIRFWGILQLPPVPDVPTGLAATPGDAEVDLSWSASAGATSYSVKRATVQGGPYTTIGSPTVTSYNDGTAVNGTTYYYVVSAVNAGGESADSSEANATPVAESPGVRVTEYYLTTGDFSGTTYTLTLDQDLAADYFILVRGSKVGDARGYPDNDYARVVSVPGGKGDLAASGANNLVGLSRYVADATWEGVVTVVECANGANAAGFRLLDIAETSMTGASGTDTITTGWTDISRVVPFGGYRSGGAEFDADTTAYNEGASVYVRVYPSGANTINWSRNAAGETLIDATMTTFVIEWGAEWTVQHANVAGNSGGGGADATGEYTTATIGSVARDNTWVWGTGNRADAGIGDCAESCLVTLGDGVNQNSSETAVAVGSEYTDAYDFDVYAMTHSGLVVDHRFKVDGDKTGVDVAVTVDSVMNASARLGWSYNGLNGTGQRHPRSRMWSRYTADGTVTISRGYDGQKFPAWVQGIDFSGLNH